MKTEGYWWAFTNDNRRFINLRVNEDDPQDRELVNAYKKHPMRFADDGSVAFVLLDNRNRNRRVRSVRMSEIKEYDDLIRSLHEDAEQREQERRRQSLLGF